MSKFRFGAAAALAAVALFGWAGELPAQSLTGTGLNGSAGLYAVPSGRIGWERRTDLGLDLGMTYDFYNKNPIVKTGLSLFKWVEVTVAEDFQPKVEPWSPSQKAKGYNNFDTIIGLKVQFPTAKTAVALGGNLQLLNHGYADVDGGVNSWTAGQIYLAVTYPGEFFGMPAETTAALGYTFSDPATGNIDYGMGFDLLVLPQVFQRFIHWIVDFSNFSYSADPLGINAWRRGSLNTGLRIDFAAIPLLSKLKFTLDVIATDIFDDGDRSFVVGVNFGIPLK